MSDLISRHAAIEEINEQQRKLIYCFGFENDIVKIMDIAKSIITALPSAQPEPHWIPCSDRFPEFDEYVLATTTWDDVTIAERLTWGWFIHEGNSNAENEDIVAWMPLPEPWRGEET